MRLVIWVRTGARFPGVERAVDGSYDVWIRAAPVAGQANRAVLKLLAGHFNVPQTQVKIIEGLTRSRKLVEILDAEDV